MSVNLLDLVKGAVGNQVLKQIGGVLGESEQNTQSAVNAAVPAILGGLMKKASTPKGAGDLFGMLDDHDGGLLDDIGRAIGGGRHESMIEKGMKLISMLFGSQQNSIIGSIAKVAGFGDKSTGSLLGILAPIVMGVLGKQRRSSGLDVGGLTNLLMSQKDHVASSLPGNLRNDLGISNLLDAGSNAVAGAVDGTRRAADNVGRAATGAVREAQSAGGNLFKYLLPLLLIAGLCWLGYKFLGPGRNAVDVPDVNLPNVNVDLPEFNLGQVNTDLTKSFGGLTDAIGGIKDEASARLVLPKLKEATDLFDGLNLDNAPAAAKTGIAATLQTLVEKIKTALETAYKIPGVRAIIEPSVGPFLEKVAAFTG